MLARIPHPYAATLIPPWSRQARPTTTSGAGTADTAPGFRDARWRSLLNHRATHWRSRSVGTDPRNEGLSDASRDPATSLGPPAVEERRHRPEERGAERRVT